MDISPVDIRRILYEVDNVLGTGSISRPCERDFLSLYPLPRQRLARKNIIQYKSILLVFYQQVEQLVYYLNRDGSYWFKHRRKGWLCITEPERIAERMSQQLQIAWIHPSHVREAQRLMIESQHDESSSSDRAG